VEESTSNSSFNVKQTKLKMHQNQSDVNALNPIMKRGVIFHLNLVGCMNLSSTLKWEVYFSHAY
jgi:hypothetical protein